MFLLLAPFIPTERSVVTAAHRSVVIRDSAEPINGVWLSLSLQRRQIIADIEIVQRKVDGALELAECGFFSTVIDVESARNNEILTLLSLNHRMPTSVFVPFEMNHQDRRQFGNVQFLDGIAFVFAPRTIPIGHRLAVEIHVEAVVNAARILALRQFQTEIRECFVRGAFEAAVSAFHHAFDLTEEVPREEALLVFHVIVPGAFRSALRVFRDLCGMKSDSDDKKVFFF